MSNGLNVCGNVVGLPMLDAQTRPSLHERPLPDMDNVLQRCGKLYGASEPMLQLFRMIGKVAPTNANVLIVGESGTGKELVANVIHQMGRNNDKPFVALNCGAVSPQLIEAELFGHERGSFTGAIRMQKGCFERADGGTLFLDEVTEMSLDMQVKLLRVLETNRFYRIGADEETEVRVRVVAATNRDPAEAVAAGLLRSDLYYRLAVFPICMPALRERGNDISLLANLFLEQLNDEEDGKKVFSRASLRLMQSYAWPGNVRELKNIVHRAFILADRELDIAAALGPMKAVPAVSESSSESVTVPLGCKLAEAEQQLICATLDHCGGNKTMTAEVLGVSLKTLYNRLNEYQSKLFLQDAIAHARPYGVQARN
ncbi:sigma-54 dependent transcriptional regulator [uncultured Oxalicibacterium sp.]|uniref:sigma-54 interaction domain-containing protein n=1 Tax=uncultured Oxalicibacterium sp. TaxID=1168540 RepID=UPI0025CFC067|nr:sigma-54 dependent transcriptional regulator [uncultured Oxalicibacterium sp.]